jgi:hypothetical protein
MHQGVRGRASKRGEFPGAGHCRRHRSRIQWGHRSAIKPYCTATNARGSTHAVILNPKQPVPHTEHDVSDLKELMTRGSLVLEQKVQNRLSVSQRLSRGVYMAGGSSEFEDEFEFEGD